MFMCMGQIRTGLVYTPIQTVILQIQTVILIITSSCSFNPIRLGTICKQKCILEYGLHLKAALYMYVIQPPPPHWTAYGPMISQVFIASFFCRVTLLSRKRNSTKQLSCTQEEWTVIQSTPFCLPIGRWHFSNNKSECLFMYHWSLLVFQHRTLL